MAAFLFPERCVRVKEQYHATVELHGIHTRGQMVLDHKRQKKPNITIIKALNENGVKEAFQLAVKP